ncbi:Mitochondrial distribution and morphology protein 34 [Colletotrichum fructicola]|uniref:Mitochondrial distribution and morphology protein 34 n=1 Tax=Colletotrichum fructicola (strain Nara gc5) TaxID=1213859 RepID=L2FUZ9_COLFN|nr:Mitochondrial distribution and morphology protein 34 [Colletotrichum fructicola]KAF4484048.1 Mitochondrial distribution and morphology protein 34 [Colletotrichum fructicola Nara gc5]KAE9577123.1 Mitochondrial distribution and morphology protein 34 [Colletotrichum fructicola]KAF4411578.1 Mitochondrial distribution and morphology protein 34 [Colletotrichum fructicola]KAF4905499.1 Mitochondrial distribution and morphology protein 34 [Colletotrichum fructicola]KAF4915719.1 Mitochondrial distrib
MAFNFNWSPLTADAEFYQRAREMLTTALNKSPKPPIIVDDILVTEFNLGSVPPELEILEIGDIAEDRFRGIFKMCYSGDAFLTLKTRVQANPLNTYLSSKPSFTSPQPLAAASGLTIPLSITLSEIKLSAFIILVFSRTKGLTLVFRNDPLESLKVSSTFDSIQFVRDYLQRTIEAQLRNLMMDELPAIIHRLSLRLWCPDAVPKDEDASKENTDETVVDPLASPPLDPVDANGNLLDANDVSSLSLEGGPEVQSLFSQKNLLRLAALNDSHRTCSLFTPGIRDVVFRAWTRPAASEPNSTPPTATPSLSKTNSFAGTSTTYTFSDTGSAAHGHLPSRPSMVSLNSATTGLSLGAGIRSKSYAGRKKKNRVVNLRRTHSEVSTPEASDTYSDIASDSASVAGPSTEPLTSCSIAEDPEQEEALAELANSTPSKVRFSPVERPQLHSRPPLQPNFYAPPTEAPSAPIKLDSALNVETTPTAQQPADKARTYPNEKGAAGENSTVYEQAWIMKMAGEIARRVYDEKNRQQQGMWDEREDVPPPAYEAST